MHSFFFDYLTLWPPLGYVLIFLGMLLEGEVVLFAAAFLTHEGFFDIRIMLLLVIVGVIWGDMLWYRLGRRLKKTSFAGLYIARVTDQFDDHLRHRPRRTIFISKFIYGLHRLILLRTGMLRIRHDKFLRSDMLAAGCWLVVVGSIGYLFSASLRHYLKFIEVALLLGLIIFMCINIFLASFLKKRL